MDNKNFREEQKERFDVILEDVEGNIRPRKVKVGDKKNPSGGGWQSAAVAGEIGFDIVLPMVLGLVGGAKLDELWGTRPKATLLLFFVGLAMGCASLIRIVRDALRRR